MNIQRKENFILEAEYNSCIRAASKQSNVLLLKTTDRWIIACKFVYAWVTVITRTL